MEVPKPGLVINPQNAVEDLSPSQLRNAVESLGMERIDGILVPAEIAHAKPACSISKPKKCSVCTRGGSVRSARTREGLLQVTMCEVRQHNTLPDCWITCKGAVFDASRFMREDEHPGGARSFLRRAGGIVDCAEDFAFHSVKGRKMWAKYRIALIIECDEQGECEPASSGGCIIS